MFTPREGRVPFYGLQDNQLKGYCVFGTKISVVMATGGQEDVLASAQGSSILERT